MSTPIRVLLVEDRPVDCELVLHELRKAGFEPDWQRVETEPEYLSELETAPDLILADWSLPQFGGARALEILQNKGLDIPFIIVSGSIGEDVAVESMRKGAADYLLKHHLARLGQAVLLALKDKSLRLERKQAEERLVASEAHYRRLFEAAWDGILILDAGSGVVKDVNPFLVEMLGSPPGEIIGKELWELGFFKDTAANKAHFLELQQKGYIRYEDLPLETHAGRKFQVEFVSNVYMVNNSRVIQCNIRDITERKRAEEALQESEERYRRLVDTMPEGVIVHSQGRVVFANPASAKISGVPSPADLVGRPVIEFVHPDYRESTLQRIRKSLSQGIPAPTLEEKFIRLDGTPFDVDVTAIPFSYAGNPAMLTLFSDITERKRASQALLESEEKYRMLVDEVNDGFYVSDASGVFTFANPALALIYGFGTPQELIGRKFLDFIAPEVLSELSHSVRSTMSSSQAPEVINGQIVRPDGSRAFIEVKAVSVVQAGHIVGSQGVVRDVTERKRAEEKVEEERILLRTLIDNLPDQVYIMDVQGRKIISNIADWQASGRKSMEEVIGKTDLEIYPPELANVYWALDKSVIDSGISIINREEPGINSLGRPHWLLSSKVPLRDGQGKVVGLVGIGRDITERKHAEEQLLFRNAILTATQEASGDGLLVVDENARIVSHNQRFIEMMGLPQELVDQQDDGPVLRFVSNSFANPEAFVEKVRFLYENPGVTAQDELLLKDGRTFDRYSSPMIGPDAVYYGRVWYFRDITKSKHSDEEIRSRNEELTGLYRLSRRLAEADDLAAVIDLVIRNAVEITHTTFASLALLQSGNLERQTVYPLKVLDRNLAPGLRQPLRDLPVIRNVLEKNEPIIVQADNPEVGLAERQSLLLDFAQSICLVPLRVGDADFGSGVPLGLLILGEAAQAERVPFTPARLHLARSIGDQAAAAIRRLLLREQARQRLDQLAALSEIDRTIASVLDLQVSLQMILRHVCDQLKVDAAAVLVFNETLQTLEYIAGRGFRSPAIRTNHQRLGEGQAGKAALQRQVVQIPDVAASQVVFAHPDLLRVEKVAAYFAVPLITKGKVKGVLEVYQRSPLNPDEEWLDFLNSLAGQAAIAIDNVQMFERLQRSTDELEMAYDATIEGWSHALDLRDKETEGHTQRVTQLTVRLARLFGISEADLVQVRWGALLHDIGKMGVPDGILLKPGPLTEEEWLIMKKHPGLAYELLKPIGYLRRALDIPFCHHEKWDGSGYPRALKGEHIPLVARIFAVVDVWDAISSDRPYRLAWSAEKARQHIQAGAGTHFDPQVVEKFVIELNNRFSDR